MSETVSAVPRGQLPSLDWQTHWQPANLKVRLERDFPPLFRAGQGLREGERARLHEMIAATQACLDIIADEKQTAQLLNFIFTSLQNPAKKHNLKTMMDTYRFALDGVPYSILRKAIGDIIRGRADGFSRVFLPTCAELTHYCDTITAAAQGCINNAQRLLTALEEQPIERISAERAKEIQHLIKQQVVAAQAATENAENKAKP